MKRAIVILVALVVLAATAGSAKNEAMELQRLAFRAGVVYCLYLQQEGIINTGERWGKSADKAWKLWVSEAMP